MRNKNKKTIFLFGFAIIIIGTLIMTIISLRINGKKETRILEFFLCERKLDNMEDVKDKGILLFTDADIKIVDWDNQIITFNKEFLENRPDNFKPRYNIDSWAAGGSKVLGVSYDMFFVLVLDGHVVFTGTFNQPFLSSKLNKDILIRDIEDDAICFYSGPSTDEIEDDRLFVYYKNKKLLK